MDGARTIGHATAVDAIGRMVATGAPHALLIVGEPGVGKTTLALDLAAGLLCAAEPGSPRPCRSCRACRLLDSGNHPDVHRLAPSGPGGQIRIGDRSDPDPGTVRALIAELALLPVEGGARIAIIESAERMNDDAQSALLKTLEEPPHGMVLVLCAADEERLLPTVRSRCARLRLGTLAVRDIERFLAARNVADPPTAARLAHFAGGRPGVALAYALAPEAAVIRAEIARSLLDLLEAHAADRLAAVRQIVARAGDLVRELGTATPPSAGRRPDADGPAPGGRRGRARGATRSAATVSVAGAVAADAADAATDEPAAVRLSAAERRRSVAQLLEIWRDVARDLAVSGLGDARSLRDPALLDDLGAARDRMPPAAATVFLERLIEAGELLDGNVGPELLVDDLAVQWRSPRAA